jgi:hypothetical protein
MFDIYVREYLRGKSGASVKGSTLHILGVLAEYFPGEVHQKSAQVLQMYMDTLKAQSQKQSPEIQLIASSFKGLASFLTQFGGSVDEGSEYIKPLYGYLCVALELVNATRHDVSKGATRNRHLLTQHSRIIATRETRFPIQRILDS